MKKTLAVLLTFILVISLITLPAAADDLIVEVNGTKIGNEASFTVFAQNLASSGNELNVYISYCDADGIVYKAESYTLPVEAKKSVQEAYTADVSKYMAKIYVWEDGLRPVAPAFTSENCGEKIRLSPDDVWTNSQPEEANNAGNVADGSLDTKWVGKDINEDDPSYVTLYLGEDYILSRVGIAFGLGNERDYLFSVSASEDGVNFSEIAYSRYNARNNNVQYIDVAPVKAKFVRYNILGRKDGGTYCQVTEVEVYGRKVDDYSVLMSNAEDGDWHINAMDEATYTDYTPSLGGELYAEKTENGLLLFDNVGRTSSKGDKLEILSVKASQEPEASSGNVALNTLDSDKATIWTASGVTDQAPATLTASLNGDLHVSKVGIAFDLGAERKYTLGVAVSEDGVNYTQIISKTTASMTNDMQYFDLGLVRANYVQFIFYQRADSTAGWIRVSEIEVYGIEGFAGAGGVMAQKQLTLPSDKGDFELSFDLNISKSANTHYSGVSITSDYVTGGADINGYAAMQLRFLNSGDKFGINYIKSNYFNEGDPIELFTNTFNRGENVNFTIISSRKDRKYTITVSDSEKTETQVLYFNHSDEELTRSSHWTWLDSNYLVFNTGAGALCEMTVSNLTVKEADQSEETYGSDPANGIIRLEAVRLDTYPTSSGDYYGRYIYHNGADEALAVAADKNPALTRFVERKGLIGVGVSLESVTLPGHFLVMEGDTVYLRKLQNNGNFYARATFFKEDAENVGYYTGDTYSYRTYIPRDKVDRYLYDADNNHKSGKLGAYKMWSEAQATFYVKSEVSHHVADNFKGNSISSQWWTNYPWKSNNPTNDSYNFSALITKNNVIVENDELLLKATKASGWPTNKNGDTGIQYNGDFGRTDWQKWQGYVGVVSIQNKVFNKQSYIEGSFKQPESPIGYWNAFWLAGRDSWPPEIDIFETLSSKYGAYAWHTAIHGENDSNNLFGKQTSSINITTGYHTFAMDWGYDYIKFYVDGKLFQRTHNNSTLNFQKNLRLILNTGIGGWESEPDDNMVWNDGLRCKYVRSFQY